MKQYWMNDRLENRIAGVPYRHVRSMAHTVLFVNQE